MVLDDLAEGDRLKDDIAVILASARQAAAIIRNVLVFARQTEPVRDPVPCAQAVDEALRLVRPLLPPTVSVVAEVTPDAGLVALGTTDMQQLLLNLVTNAIKAMAGSGTVRVTLGRRTLDEPEARRLDMTAGPCFVLTVADTGCGMDAATRALVFEPFFTTRPAGEGTGLGLSVVFGIVRGAGGAIQIDSEIGVGTQFVILLPEYR